MNVCIEHSIPRPLTNAEEQLLCGQRRWLHQRPEIAFKEFATADYVAAQLERLGLEPERGLAGTGVVATIQGREADRSVGLRADMDALPVHETTGLPLGTVAVMPGPMMASFDVFEITLEGAGGHAGMPHRVDDVVVAGSAVALALQNIISRRLDPALCGVVSITQVQAGSAWNVLPDRCVLKGCCRALGTKTQDLIEHSMREIAIGVGTSYGACVDVRYERRIPATINDPGCAALAAACAQAVLGAARVKTDLPASMAGEDFSFMLERCPGACLWLGIGEDHPPLHSSRYDFDDRVIADGARMMASLALAVLNDRLALRAPDPAARSGR